MTSETQVTTRNSGPVAYQRRTAVLGSLPALWPADVRASLSEWVGRAQRKVVVVDDDPTGTQTVHDIPVLTSWEVESLARELVADGTVFYVLTNSRSLAPADARKLTLELGANLRLAAKLTGRDFVIVSRSDSTLRGHFPVETDALGEALGEFDATLLVPFFDAGGRLTVNDIHYVTEGNWLLPAAESQFARDANFGYSASNLRSWVEEKTKGKVNARNVESISLDDIRRGGPERVTERLQALRSGAYCIVNAVLAQDLDVFVMGLLQAESRGRKFLYRTAASFVAARAALKKRSLLDPAELDLPTQGGGLIVVGSHVAKTSEQLEHLLIPRGSQAIESIEVSVDTLLGANCETEIKRVATLAENVLRKNEDIVIYTSRSLQTSANAVGNFEISHRVSEALVSIVRSISVRPRYLLAKGGITASDIATGALGVKRALVLGQVLPGVPVWRLGAESRYPNLPFIIFPGNVGTPDALAQIVTGFKSTLNGHSTHTHVERNGAGSHL